MQGQKSTKRRSLAYLAPSLLTAAVLAACGGGEPAVTPTTTAQIFRAQVQSLPSRAGLSVNYEIIQNGLDASTCNPLGADWGLCFKGKITLHNSAKAIAPGRSDFAIIVPSPRRLLGTLGQEWTIEHLTGDLHKLSPTDAFKGLGAGQSAAIEVVGEYWQILQSDFFPNWLALEGGKASVIANTKDDSVAFGTLNGLWKRTPSDANIKMDVNTRFDAYADVPPTSDSAARIIPAPLSQTLGTQTASVKHGIFFDVSGNTGLGWASENAVRNQLSALGLQNHGVNDLRLQVRVQPGALPTAARAAGGYRLEITPTAATVTGFDAVGAFYGVQSLLSLIDVQEKTALPTMTVVDAPRFAYRGHMIDIGRNFQSAETIKKIVDEMALVKLNTLHLHLSDDEGWRLAIEGLPELTEVGARRAFASDEHSALSPQLGSAGGDGKTDGYLSRQQFVDLLSYAKARHVEVIPELDMPGHSRAAVMSMEARYNKLLKQGDARGASQFRLLEPADTSQLTTVQFYDRKSILNPCLESTERFTRKVMTEVAQMYHEAGLALPTWHTGGDEAKNIKLGGGFPDKTGQDHPWGKSPACSALIAAGRVPNAEALPSYFIKNVANWAHQAGYPRFQSWSDGMKGVAPASSLPAPTAINVWDTLFWGGSDAAADWTRDGFGVVLSNPDYLYLDMPNEVDPQEPGYYWASRGTTLKKMFSFAPENLAQNAETSLDRDGRGFSITSGTLRPLVSGLSTHSWGETVRSPQRLGYMTFPRLYAAAERAWHKADWELGFTASTTYDAQTNRVDKAALNADYNAFAGAVAARAFNRLSRAGMDYRLPKPGAQIIQGRLQVRSEMPGITVQYRSNNGHWINYNPAQAPQVSSGVQVRSVQGGKTGESFTVN